MTKPKGRLPDLSELTLSYGGCEQKCTHCIWNNYGPMREYFGKIGDDGGCGLAILRNIGKKIITNYCKMEPK